MCFHARMTAQGRGPAPSCDISILALVDERLLLDPRHHAAQLRADLLDRVRIVHAPRRLEARLAGLALADPLGRELALLDVGEYVSGPRIITDETRAEMRRVLADIQQGKFTSEWIRECKAGQPKFKATRRLNDAHPIEEIGTKLRAMMPWIKEKALVDKSKN